MSKSDWESLQVKRVQWQGPSVERLLFLAMSSVFFAFYSCYGTALASEYEEKSYHAAEDSIKILPSEQSFEMPLAETGPLSTMATSSPALVVAELVAEPRAESVAESIVEPIVESVVSPVMTSGVHISRMDRQHTPAVNIDAEAGSDVEMLDSSMPVAADDTCIDERLDIPTRFGVTYATSSAGFDEVGGINAFVPLDQDECEDILFLEGGAQLSDGNLGFGVNVGYRDYDTDDDLINGGYLGVDSRSTDNSTFYQLAAGYEHIKDNWELRLNGYLPIGSDTNTIQSVDVDNVQSTSGFEANQLVLSAVGERQRVFQQENALGGFDVEVGVQLDEWYGGEIRGYLGAYLLSGEESSLGAQARLLADFESNFNAGLSVQYDDLFGTSVGFGVSASLPGQRFHDDGERTFQEENEVVIRLRDSIVRRPNVAINAVNESEIIAVDEREALRNPEEEEDYRFVHVDLAGGAGTGDGTFENPFGAVEDAIALLDTDADTFSDGNTIVYVDGESDPAATIPGFAIPDRVRVLSQGPEQVIAGMAFPGFPTTNTRLPFSPSQNFNVDGDAPNANGITVSLPNSNDGVFPTITGGGNADLVALGNSTVLAGFQITGAAANGVSATDVFDVELRNNLIENSGDSGIALNNVGGSAVLFDNVINGSADRGILVQNDVSVGLEVEIAGFDLSDNRVGMEFVNRSSTSESPSQDISVGLSTAANTSVGTPGGTVLTNSIVDSTEEGILIEATGDSTMLANAATQEVSVAATTIDGSGSAGVRLLTRDGAHSQEFSLVDQSTVSNSGGNGIEVVNGDDFGGLGRTAAVQEFVVRDSTIADNDGNGIDLAVSDLSAQEIVIRRATITDNGGDGIRSIAQNASVQEWRTDAETGDAGISESTISGNGGQAVVIEVEDTATLPIVSVVDNDLSDNTLGDDLEITSTNGQGVAACLIIRDNIAPMGIQLTGTDPLLTGGIASVLVQDLETLLMDSNITFLSDLNGITSPSNAPFADEPGDCTQ